MPELIPYQDAIIVSLVLLFIIVTLYKEWIGPGFTFMIGIITLGIFGILTPTEILAGFANEQIAVIILLLVMGDFIRQSAVLDGLFNRMFSKATSVRGFLARMTLVVAGFSAFLNNTPLVAIMMPFTYNWGKRNGISVSKLLIPLSYAAILGGCATLIGTSTNLIVNGLVTDQYIIPGLRPLNIFDFTAVGLPMIIIGFFYLLLFSDKLLPVKKDVLDDMEAKTREYMVEVQIREGSDIIGKTVEEAGLRNLKGLFLVEVIRGPLTVSAVSRSTMLFKDDILIFAGDTKTIAEMIKHLDQNHIPWGIVTNKPSWLAKPIVANTPELSQSQVLICADQVGVGKPDPKPLLIAAEQMALVHQTTLYLGDAKSDIDAAHAAGMKSAVAMWGYLAPEDQVEEWGAHHRFILPGETLGRF